MLVVAVGMLAQLVCLKRLPVGAMSAGVELTKAAAKGDARTVKSLLDRGTNANSKAAHGMTVHLVPTQICCPCASLLRCNDAAQVLIHAVT